MRDFLRYVFKSREGLAAYLVYLASALGGLFLMYMLFLVVLKKDGAIDVLEADLFEPAAVLFSAVFFLVVMSRLLNISVNGGISRRSFILGTAVICPVFAVITSVIIEAANMITAEIYSAFGVRLESIMMSSLSSEANIKSIAAHDPEFIFFEVCVIFLLVITAFAAVLIYFGIQKRFGTAAAVIVIGFFLMMLYISRNTFYGYSYIDDLYGELDRCMHQMDYVLYHDLLSEWDYYDEPVYTYAHCVMTFILTGLGVFAAGYLLYLAALRRAPVRGKKQGGVI
ncbi:MAG: hypothetical protein J6M17_00265 [Ruminococcus sp.]|nr:hypothetical protein [Ruminococcus sp.]